MRAKGIRVLEYVGQPEDLVLLETRPCRQTAGTPEVILLSGNFYDAKYAEEAAGFAPNLYIQSQFHPFELAADNKATQDYLDLMEQYNPSGKVALLGVQGMSSWLLFAQSAAACGSDLTADCLLEKAAAAKDWTGGGLHAPQTPGNDEPSRATSSSPSARTASPTTRTRPSPPRLRPVQLRARQRHLAHGSVTGLRTECRRRASR